jgi:hypothetical protein
MVKVRVSMNASGMPGIRKNKINPDPFTIYGKRLPDFFSAP